ncbi:alginate lyase family protein [Haloferula sargassicola]|uniref:Alginate lyase domain-containing protein n=1 Tax=Haloferula sargassicola TaxID=490096 RepID=A0ABP9UNJ5_9BACT
MLRRFLVRIVSSSLLLAAARADFVHPGCLSSREDLARMADKVAAREQPWLGSWEILVKNTDGFLDDAPETQSPITAGGRGENYIRLARDAAKSYQLALRFHGAGDERFALKAVEILNAWAAGHEGWAGDSNVCLRAGLYGQQLACAAELLRDFPGWERTDFQGFQRYLRERFYSVNHDFLTRHNGTVPGHYWANWDLANMASMLAIGVVCDDPAIFDEAVRYLHEGDGAGALRHAVVFLHPDGLGQWQESGRDQGHALMGPQLMGAFCEIAWNQGLDLYGSLGHRFLASVEYSSKYNLGHDVPFVAFVREWGHLGKERQEINPTISEYGRGMSRPGWDLIFNHYVRRCGLAAPWTAAYAGKSRPEGGGFNYGSTSGGFDSLGFTTLTHTLDSSAAPAPPADPRAVVTGRRVSLSWTGTAGATRYRVDRADRAGGPFTRVAVVKSPARSVIDICPARDTTYLYRISAILPGGTMVASRELKVATDLQLTGRIIGTEGSFADSGADKFTVFDGSLDNYFDPPGPDAWVGLDLGEGVSAQVTGIRFCPRKGMADRMVGGRFQGSDDPDFLTGVANLFTVTSEPPDNIFTTADVAAAPPCRYLRYLPPAGGWCSVAEIQILGRPEKR